MRTILIQADYRTIQNLFDEGSRTVPDLGDLAGQAQETGPKTYTGQWVTGGTVHAFTVVELPSLVEGERWFAGVGDPNLVGALTSNGVAASRIYSNPPMPKRQAFVDAGLKVVRRQSDGAVVALAPPIVFAGVSPLGAALATITPDEGEEYYIE